MVILVVVQSKDNDLDTARPGLGESEIVILPKSEGAVESYLSLYCSTQRLVAGKTILACWSESSTISLSPSPDLAMNCICVDIE